MARARRVDVATVRLWDHDVGAVAWNAGRGVGEFEYDHAFLRQGFDVAPLTMPRRSGVMSFPELNRNTFHGLPGLLADALPDRFGNRIIDIALRLTPAWPFRPMARHHVIKLYKRIHGTHFRRKGKPSIAAAIPRLAAPVLQSLRHLLCFPE